MPRDVTFSRSQVELCGCRGMLQVTASEVEGGYHISRRVVDFKTLIWHFRKNILRQAEI